LSQPGLGPDLTDSLITRVQQRWPELRLVHRLDRDTSGLLLLAFSPEIHRQLSGLFAARAIQKAYLAEVAGHPRAQGGLIDRPLARIDTRPPRYGVLPVEQGGKPALTQWRVLQRRWDGQGRPIARLLLVPRTGRSHQLRVHLEQIGHPILGDPIYGSASGFSEGASEGADRLRLHAWGLRFRHPATGKTLRLRCPAPWDHPDGPRSVLEPHG
jgi:tRNA pseudouridine32 synthase/23S rRNA pseudouridine746 synthase